MGACLQSIPNEEKPISSFQCKCFRNVRYIDTVEVKREYLEKVTWKMEDTHINVLLSVFPYSIVNIIKTLCEDINCKITIKKVEEMKEMICKNNVKLSNKPICTRWWDETKTLKIFLIGEDAWAITDTFLYPSGFKPDYNPTIEDNIIEERKYLNKNFIWNIWPISINNLSEMNSFGFPLLTDYKPHMFALIFPVWRNNALKELTDSCQLILNNFQHSLKNCILFALTKKNKEDVDRVICDSEIKAFCDKWRLDCVEINLQHVDHLFDFMVKYYCALKHYL
eukprot:366548_1